MSEIIQAEVIAVSASIELINVEDKLTMKLLADKINEIIAKLNTETTSNRNRGPKSEKDMTEEDARRIMLTDLKDVSHKDAAKELGLSYGQIYSARKGFTFKVIYQEMIKASKSN